MNLDLTKEPVGYDTENEPVYLKDMWPDPKEISDTIRKAVKASSFRTRYGDVFEGTTNWKKVKAPKGQTYTWNIGSTNFRNPPYLEGLTLQPKAGGEDARAPL